MIIRDPNGLEASGRVHHSSDGALTSLRCLTKSDGLGLMVTLTRTHRDLDQDLTFTGHRETSLLLEGAGRLETCQNGKAFDLFPGTLWSVGQEQPHRLTMSAGARVLSVFNPALKGPDENSGTAANLVWNVSVEDGSDGTVLIAARDGLGFSLDWRRGEAGQDVMLVPDTDWIGYFVATGAAVVTVADASPNQPVAADTTLVIEKGEQAVFQAATTADLIVFAPDP